MRVSIDITKEQLGGFDARCNLGIMNIGRGAKNATEQACKEILAASNMQVPKDTSTLASSAFYDIRRRGDVKGYSYEATLGYGGNGDPINPKTGKPASYYMVKIHEDMSMPHRNGKAKFLEDPVREYADRNFKRVVFERASEALMGMSR